MLIHTYKNENSKIPSKSEEIINFCFAYISYHIFIFHKHAKIHKNRHVKGENSQKARRGQKGLSPNLENLSYNWLIYQQIESKHKQNKNTLPTA